MTVLVGVLCLSVTSCAVFNKTQTNVTQQQKLIQIKKAADTLTTAGLIVEQALNVEQAFFNAKAITPDTHQAIRAYVHLFAAHVQEVLRVLDDFTVSDVARHQAVQQLVLEAERGLQVHFPDTMAQDRIRAVFGILRAVLAPILDLV